MNLILDDLAGRGIDEALVRRYRLDYNPGENGRPAIFRAQDLDPMNNPPGLQVDIRSGVNTVNPDRPRTTRTARPWSPLLGGVGRTGGKGQAP